MTAGKDRQIIQFKPAIVRVFPYLAFSQRQSHSTHYCTVMTTAAGYFYSTKRPQLEGNFPNMGWNVRMYKQPDVYGAIIAWIAEHKGELLSAVLAAIMALLRGAYAGGGKIKVMLDAAMCSVMAWFIKDILMIVNLEPNWALIVSVFVGYLGTDYIGSILKRLIGNKSGATNTNGS